jgi:glycosyltransferase involved in cell wall biosynthesis
MTWDLCVSIATKGRQECLTDAVASILCDPDEPVQLFVLDQNEDDRAVEALTGFAADPRLHHVRLEVSGAGRARNVALERSASEVICFTDDDCTVPPGWARDMTAAVRSDPNMAMAFCAVDEPVVHAAGGYTPAHQVTTETTLSSWTLRTRVDQLGIGAGMALDRAAALEIGGFDPLMGPGSLFPSADDREIAIRLLLTGRGVINLPQPVAVHHGFRATGVLTRALSKRDHIALGAMFGKFVRVAPARTAGHLVLFLIHSGVRAAHDSVTLRRPAGLGKIGWTIVGFVRGVRQPVDTDSVVFHDKAA